MTTNNVVLGNINDDHDQEREGTDGPCGLPWCRGQGGEEIRRVKKRPGANNLWDCACMTCGTGPAGMNSQMTNHVTYTSHDWKSHMLTNVVVSTRLALLRKSRRDQEVQARRNMPPAGVVPLREQEPTEEAMDKDMELEPAADLALAQQADLALAQQQQQQNETAELTDRDMDLHATRLAAGIPGMLAHLPVRREELPTPLLEAFTDREEGGEEEGKEEEEKQAAPNRKRKREEQEEKRTEQENKVGR